MKVSGRTIPRLLLLVSNSKFLVFYREQCHITLYGNATTWNST